MSGEAVTHVYAVAELPMSGDDREEVFGIFTDLHMAMVLFNTLVEKLSGRCRYYTNSGDLLRVEPEDGKGSAYAVTRYELTSRPGRLLTEVKP